MKLASRRQGRDGALLVVSRDGSRYVPAHDIAPTLQAALDDWPRVEPQLRRRFEELVAAPLGGHPLSDIELTAPLPRAYEWIDGSAFVNHILLVRRARGAEPPARLHSDPLVYQGASGCLLGPNDPFSLGDERHGLDFEAEVAVVLGDTPRGTAASDAQAHIRLLLLANDWTFRNLIPPELAKGFGFFVSKPATAFSPFAVTPDELGPAYHDGRLHLPLQTRLNGVLVGDPNAGAEMHFSFCDLLAHITQTRALTAGTILGSGTVSNADPARGVSCLAELRAREMIATGQPATPFLRVGDQIEIAMFDEDGVNVFGTISERVVA
ncbi:MAG TPA: fumarylacetoacetate hydrolase family protein [Polyangiaceae bacterium]|nr:fumarylacetoacetate hydrolase family protein [Polyangiaceae bacterium]